MDKGKLIIFICIMVSFLCIAICSALLAERNDLRHEAIEKGTAYYHPKTGKFTFKEFGK